ncbi:MAG: hypothetical protein U9P12_00395 [Verrucomicrobiota bacterium]|nr:hypothetical protein [Verrucomicrobiota bacterium]
MSRESKRKIQDAIKRSAERSTPRTTAQTGAFASRETIYRIANSGAAHPTEQVRAAG